MLRRIRTPVNEGFTLIELLIVVIILGILAAIVVFAVGQTRGESLTATCRTDVKSIQLAAEAVKTHEGGYPSAQTGLLATSTSTNGAVLKSWPDSSNLSFAYSGSGTGSTSTYSLTVGGGKVKGGTLTPDSTDRDVDDACAAV